MISTLLYISFSTSSGNIEIRSICRYLRVEASIFEHSKHIIPCEHCNENTEEEIIVYSGKSSNVTTLTPSLLFPNITSIEFGCSEVTYVILLSNLRKLLIDLICFLTINQNFELPLLHMDELQCSNINLIQTDINELLMFMRKTFRIANPYSNLERFIPLIDDINTFLDELTDTESLKMLCIILKRKYIHILDSPGLCELIANYIKRLGDKVNCVPEVRWFFLITYIKVRQGDDSFIYYHLIDLLMLLRIVEKISETKDSTNRRTELSVYSCCVNILTQFIVNRATGESRRVTKIIKNILFNLEHMLERDEAHTNSKLLLRSYLYFFSNNITFLTKFDQYLEKILHSFEKKNWVRQTAPDGIIYNICATLDSIYHFILKDC